MTNKWKIPKEVEDFVLKRDLNCVYCGIKFSSDHSRKSKASWEHIVNDIRINGIDNIALSCVSCNSSKGSKLLTDWLESKYCTQKNINLSTVSTVVKNAYLNPPKLI